MGKSGNPAKRAEPREVAWTPFELLERKLATGEAVWANSRYYVIVALRKGPVEWAGVEGTHDAHLSLRRLDRRPGPFPWRDLQRLKSELCGSEAEAVEVFPAESRVIDGSNQRHLWVWRATMPRLGWYNGREVASAGEILATIQADPVMMAHVVASGGNPKHLGLAMQAEFEDGTDAGLGHDGVIW